MNEEDVTGVSPLYHEVVRDHGRAMFDLVYSTGIAGHAIGILGKAAGRDRQLQIAIRAVAETLNTLVSGTLEYRGWTLEAVEACDRAIRHAVEGKIILPGGKRGLDS